jgi:hypothetical protein
MKENWRMLGSERLLPLSFRAVSFLTYSSAVNIEAKYSSETSVDFQRTTKRYIPEDRISLDYVNQLKRTVKGLL